MCLCFHPSAFNWQVQQNSQDDTLPSHTNKPQSDSCHQQPHPPFGSCSHQCLQAKGSLGVAAEGGDGGGVQEGLKAPLHWFCAVRGVSDPNKASRKNRSAPQWSIGWLGLETHTSSSPSPEPREAKPFRTHIIPWVGKWGKWVGKNGEMGKVEGILQLPFSYYCNDLLPVPHPHLHSEGLHACNGLGQLCSLAKQPSSLDRPISAALERQHEVI